MAKSKSTITKADLQYFNDGFTDGYKAASDDRSNCSAYAAGFRAAMQLGASCFEAGLDAGRKLGVDSLRYSLDRVRLQLKEVTWETGVMHDVIERSDAYARRLEEQEQTV